MLECGTWTRPRFDLTSLRSGHISYLTSFAGHLGGLCALRDLPRPELPHLEHSRMANIRQVSLTELWPAAFQIRTTSPKLSAVLQALWAGPTVCGPSWKACSSTEVCCVRTGSYATDLPGDLPRGFDLAARQRPSWVSPDHGLLLQASWTEGCSTFLRRLLLRYCEQAGSCHYCIEVRRQAASNYVPRQPCVQLSRCSRPGHT